MKICSKCKIEKSIEEFYKNNQNKDGLKSWCKDCHKEDSRKRESQYNETRRNYRLNNQEEYRVQKKLYYNKNKEKVLTNNANWRNLTFNGRLSTYKRGANYRNIQWDLTDEEFASFWNKECYYCGDEIKTVGIDRIDSTKGYDINNTVPCCTQCNIIKMDYTQHEFLTKIKQIYEYQRNKGRFN
jgi:hypothetical protein